MMESNSQDKLAWDAFCYVSGDMPSDAQARFETLLAEDQQAREAVAVAVELTQAAAVALAPQPAAARQRHSLPAYWWAAVGAAACLLLMFTWQQFLRQDPSSGDPSVANAAGEENSRALAVRWSEVRQREEPIDPFDGEFAHLNDWAIDDASGDAMDNSFGSAAAPEWMLAAVAQTNQRTAGDDMLDDMERQVDPPREQ